MNLRVVEKEDLPLLADWFSDPRSFGEFVWLTQQSGMEREKWYDDLGSDAKFFFIEKKDGKKIGTIAHFLEGTLLEIGYLLVPNERRKGYCSEATQIMVDYLFLSKSHSTCSSPCRREECGFPESSGKSWFQEGRYDPQELFC